jgi:polysaccharide pyruvyl transferase WcaK-like protein
MEGRQVAPKRIAFFGHFNTTNFGNESTLQAILYHLRRFLPGADVFCISSGPEATAATHQIKAIPINEVLLGAWMPRTKVGIVLRKLLVGLPSEPYRWIRSLVHLRRTDMLIIPGTGLLNDADGFSSRGPYNLFKWVLIARLCRCKVIFVSVGAGPIYGGLSRHLVKAALSFAEYRSYRDRSTMDYLNGIGFRTDRDRVYPDLAFSLPEVSIPTPDAAGKDRPVVGLGVMVYAGKYSTVTANDSIYLAYLKNLTFFVKSLLAHDYDVRLLSGDIGDVRAIQDLRELLKKELSESDEERIIYVPLISVGGLLSQIAATDIVVATRFHNLVFGFLCNKPVIAISFHHKCESLMRATEQSDYCLDINDVTADDLIEKFCDLARNADKIKASVGEKAREFRKQLDEQYQLIFDIV